MSKPFTYPSDQTALDQLFNNRLRWPDFAKHLARWQRNGLTALKTPGWQCDVPYGPGPRQVFDILVPRRTAAARAPLFIFIHGGYWQSLAKSDVRGLGPAFARRGIAFASLEYALCPQVTVETTVRQIYAALAHLWRAAPGFGCDPQRLYVGGHSAGGHLATMVASDPACAVPVAGYLSVSGVYDLAPLQRSYQQPVLRLTDREARLYSPLRRAPKPGTQLWLTVGGDETAAFIGQQADLVAAWRAKGAKIKTVAAPGLGHFDIVDQVANFAHPIGKAALAMMAT